MFIKMFINFVFYPQATVRMLVFTSLLVFLTPVLAESPELYGYVWDFETDNSTEKDLAKQITDEFEERFSCFKLLNRRDRDRLKSQMNLEREIRSVKDLSPQNKEMLLKESSANMFIFGNLRDNYTEGETTIRVTIESLATGEILAPGPKSVGISPRGKRFDSQYRQEKLEELVKKLCPNEQDSKMPIPSPLKTALAPVPKTRQTTSYSVGDDGQWQKGVASPSPHFTNNNNGTVTDNLTGLIWLRNADCANGQVTWITALHYVAQLNSAGSMNNNYCGDVSNGGSHQTDWRLPNVKELQSLIDFSKTGPALPSEHPFLGVRNDWYWSATTWIGNTTAAWIVQLDAGDARGFSKTFTYHVWPVRGGQ